MRWVSAGGMMPPEVWRRRAARRPPGPRRLRSAAGGGVPAAAGGAAEELGAEHLLQQALGKHRRNDRVLGAVPRQRLEFAVKVAGDVDRAGPWRLGGGWELGSRWWRRRRARRTALSACGTGRGR